MDRYFVVIFARDRDAMRGLQSFHLDVFPQTAEHTNHGGDFPLSIDGLLSMAEVERVVKAGFQVQIQEDAERRSRVGEKAAEFPEWLQGMQSTLTKERTASRKKPPDKK